jgi:hypothetical protein
VYFFTPHLVGNCVVCHSNGLGIEVSSISLYLERTCLTFEEEKWDRYLNVEEVKILEITINTKQGIAIVWTLIAIVLSLIVVLAMGLPYQILGVTSYSSAPWWLMIAAFFAVLLVITLPVYLLIALWGIVSKSENE